ncbi:aldo-keto reductase family 1 member A1 [Halyomorpha halys]|uniref:aldo-keto reductase family 1 member A1 n=1 Tax=Halyomorpha halys TaxID=286706 RepID=UPI0006D50FC0|nr:alcohol dehydrogenase [NADP(+)]-like [Halyomorpha halys]
MEYHSGSCIGAGDVRIPILSISTWKTNDEDLENALNTALGLGYRGIRTWFGECKAIGPILREMFQSNKIRREDIFISASLPPIGNRFEDVEHFLKFSLDLLQLDYLDLFTIGSPMAFIREGDLMIPVNENGEVLLDLKSDFLKTWKGMEEQVTAGRTKSIGLAYFNLSQVQRILDHCTIKPANLITELHVYCQQKELVSFCKRNGIVLTAEFPFGSPGLQQFVDSLDGDKKFIPSPLKDPVILDLAKKHKKRPSQIILRYLTECGMATLIKAMNPKRIRECFDIFDFQLTGEDLDRIRELDQGEEGRIFGGSASTGLLSQFEKHPEFPYKKNSH